MSSSSQRYLDKKRKVARRACLTCREKKIKCDGEFSIAEPGSASDGLSKTTCTNCANAGMECVFVASQRGGRRVAGKTAASQSHSEPRDSEQPHSFKIFPPNAPPAHDFPHNTPHPPPPPNFRLPPPSTGYDYNFFPPPPPPPPHHSPHNFAHYHHPPSHHHYPHHPYPPHHHNNFYRRHQQHQFPGPFSHPQDPYLSDSHSPVPPKPRRASPPSFFRPLSPPGSFLWRREYRHPDRDGDSRDFSTSYSKTGNASEQYRNSSSDIDGSETFGLGSVANKTISSVLDLSASPSSTNASSLTAKPSIDSSGKSKLSLAALLVPEVSPRAAVTSYCAAKSPAQKSPALKKEVLSLESGYSDEALQEFGFSSWNDCLLGIDVFYKIIHPQFPILPSKSQFQEEFSPIHNAALLHSLFLCASPYMQNERLMKKAFHHKMISAFWHRLDLVSSLQTSLLLAFYYIRSAENRDRAEEFLLKAAKIIHFSRIPKMFAENDLQELMKVTPHKVGQQRKLLLAALWRLYFIAYMGRLYYDDSAFCSDMTWSGSKAQTLRKLLNVDELPFPSKEVMISLKSEMEAASMPNIIDRNTRSSNTASLLCDAISQCMQLMSNPNSEKSPIPTPALELAVNSALVRSHGRKTVIDFQTLEAKLVLLAMHIKRILSSMFVMPRFCEQGIGTEQFFEAYLAEYQEVLQGNFLRHFEIDMAQLIELFLVVQDCTVLLKIASSAFLTWSENGFLGSKSMLSTSEQFDTSVNDSDSAQSPTIPDKLFPAEHLTRLRLEGHQTKNAHSSKLENVFTPSQFKELWKQYPPLFRTIMCQVIPLQGLLLTFSKISTFSSDNQVPQLFYAGQEKLFLSDEVSNAGIFKDRSISSFRFGIEAGELKRKGDFVTLLECLCDSSYMLNDLKLCLEYLHLDASLFEENGNILPNIRTMSIWAKTLFPTP
ncbi:LAME_0F10550g1_1 [Lachancea meyersii CBS 8951]|uniref:LAME_0F10550g1_1 n=1 Tax=Lachancea meyersii CBS 8951 TaxID=1266667 RepID=A0A1G4JVK8_9SACH|nr:LAME_0F10550g1_1 [Lachancea meyersii CBS 8951]